MTNTINNTVNKSNISSNTNNSSNNICNVDAKLSVTIFDLIHKSLRHEYALYLVSLQ